MKFIQSSRTFYMLEIANIGSLGRPILQPTSNGDSQQSMMASLIIFCMIYYSCFCFLQLQHHQWLCVAAERRAQSVLTSCSPTAPQSQISGGLPPSARLLYRTVPGEGSNAHRSGLKLCLLIFIIIIIILRQFYIGLILSHFVSFCLIFHLSCR